MIIPIGNSGDLKRAPFITIIIILINIIAFIAVKGRVNEDNNKIMNSYYEYSDVLLEYLMDHEGYTFAEILSDQEHFKELMEKPEIDSLSIYYKAITDAKAKYENAMNDHVFNKLGVSGKNKSVINFLTAMFTHADIFHLIGNLWFLMLLGANVEDTYGRMNFLIFYILSGIVSSLIFILSQGDPNIPLIGASGAIAGVMGVFMVRHFKTKIKFFYFFFPFRPFFGTFRIIAGIVLPLWFLQQIVDASGQSDSGIAFMAHIGGFIFGVIIAVLINYFKIEEKYIAPRIQESTNLMGFSVDEQKGLDAYYDGKFKDAALILEEPFLKKYNYESFIPLFESLTKCGNNSRAAFISDLYLSEVMKGEDKTNLQNIFREMEAKKLIEFAGSGALFKMAKEFSASGLHEDARYLFTIIIEKEKFSILGAKILVYIINNDIGIEKEREFFNSYMENADDETKIVLMNVKRGYNEQK